MKKIFQWFMKPENTLFVILIVIIAPLYVIFLSQYINEKTSQVLLSIAAIISTILVFFTLREYNMTNRLKTVEPILSDFLKDIQDLEEKSKQCVFSEPEIKTIEIGIPYPEHILRNITYFSFISSLYELYNSVKNNIQYKECLKKLGDKDRVLIENIDNVKEIGKVLNSITEGLSRVVYFYSQIFIKYSEIDGSELTYKQKKFVFKKLAKIHIFYTNFCEKLNENMNAQNHIYFDIYNFKLFRNYDNLILPYSYENFHHIMLFNDDIEKIRKKYQ